jgi:hypothetical protein
VGDDGPKLAGDDDRVVRTEFSGGDENDGKK